MECLAHMLLHTSLHAFNMETECFEFIFCAVQDNWKKAFGTASKYWSCMCKRG